MYDIYFHDLACKNFLTYFLREIVTSIILKIANAEKGYSGEKDICKEWSVIV